jgi:hypothetical protein
MRNQPVRKERMLSSQRRKGVFWVWTTAMRSPSRVMKEDSEGWMGWKLLRSQFRTLVTSGMVAWGRDLRLECEIRRLSVMGMLVEIFLDQGDGLL